MHATRNHDRTGARGAWLDRDRARIVGVVLFAVVVAAGFVAGVEYVSRPDRFPVLSVRLEGDFKHVTRDQLMGAVGNHLRGNLFLLDLDAVRQRVEALPWVHHASVRRQWPQTVQIYFSEQQLVARWRDKLWLNRFGEVVDLGSETGPADLPMLAGPDGTHEQVLAEFQRLNDITRRSGVDVAELRLSDQRTWRARLGNNLVVLLGRQEAENRLARLMEVYGDTVANRVDYIRQVDLRYTNGFSVEWVRAAPVGVRNEG